jgi:hypothetical protein
MNRRLITHRPQNTARQTEARLLLRAKWERRMAELRKCADVSREQVMQAATEMNLRTRALALDCDQIDQ